MVCVCPSVYKCMHWTLLTLNTLQVRVVSIKTTVILKNVLIQNSIGEGVREVTNLKKERLVG